MINPWRWVDPRINQVCLAQVRAYLESIGWVAVSNPNPKVIRYEWGAKTKGERLHRFVPASEDFSDFHREVAELITLLAALEDRHPVHILEDVLRLTPEAMAGTGSNDNGATGEAKPTRRVRT
jgi:hypothetical protein